ncbi:MAG: hypothetical protein SXQ77_02250 [Halobacteria archaeon]|nr:hypothetical protein [Halobacteria archaeon]
MSRSNYSLDVADLYRDDRKRYDETTCRVARRVAETTDVESIRLKGLSDVLREEDEEAFERVVATIEDDAVGWIEGHIDAENADAVLSLFSKGLTQVVFEDGNDTPVFARYDDGQVYFTVPEEVLRRVCYRLSWKRRLMTKSRMTRGRNHDIETRRVFERNRHSDTKRD